MSILTAFRLNFKSPLHLGSVRADYDTSDTIQHSDTLYAAIVQAWCSLGLEGQLAELIDDTGQPKGLTLSSLFPYHKKDNNFTYFFPVPLGTVDSAEGSLRKKIKKAKFIDSTHFKRIQERGKVWVLEEAMQGDFITAEKDFEKGFLSKQVFPRARVPRSGITSDTEIYYLERIFFKEDCGLYCLAHFEDMQQKDRILAMLKFLGDEGIGTDRHVGHGLFEVEEVEDMSWAPSLTVESDYGINLSLYLPEDQKQLKAFVDDRSRYKMIKRGGWITTASYLTYRKQSVHMFKEGGLFYCNTTSAGKTVDLRPRNLPIGKNVQIPIYRSGKSLFVPINLDLNQ